MSDDAAGPSAPPPSSSPLPLPEAATPLSIAWSVFAGFFLLLAPAVPAIWDRVSVGEGALRHVAALQAVRIGTSAVGVLLLMVGSWDLSTALVARWTR